MAAMMNGELKMTFRTRPAQGKGEMETVLQLTEASYQSEQNRTAASSAKHAAMFHGDAAPGRGGPFFVSGLAARRRAACRQ